MRTEQELLDIALKETDKLSKAEKRDMIQYLFNTLKNDLVSGQFQDGVPIDLFQVMKKCKDVLMELDEE